MKILVCILVVIMCAGLVFAQVPPMTAAKVRTIAHDTANAVRNGLTVNTALTNAKNYGDFPVFGHVPIVNNAISFDTSSISCTNAATQLALSLPASIVADANSADTASFLHPTAVYYPNGFGGYKLWAAFSLGPGAKVLENTFVRASNDGGATWVVPNSTPDPLFDSASCNDSTAHAIQYFSDPCLFPGTDGKLYCFTRAVYSYSGEVYIWCRSTSDGSTWSTAKVAIGKLYVNGGMRSPCVWPDTNGSYVMIVTGDVIDGHNKRSVIIRYTSPKADSGWSVGTYGAGDTVKQAGATGTYTNFPTGASTSVLTDDTMGNSSTYSYSAGSGWVPWHLGVVDLGADEKLILITAQDSTRNVATGIGNTVLFLGATSDGCKTLRYITTPILRPTASGKDSTIIYKACGWVEDKGNQKLIRMLYSSGCQYWTYPNKKGGWRTSMTTLSFPLSTSIGTGAVTTTGILDGTIALADMGASSVDSTKIVSDAALLKNGGVDSTKLSATALAELRNNSVDSNKIAAASVSSTTDINWPQEAWHEFQVDQRTPKKVDSVALWNNVRIGDSVTAQEYLWYDSIWTQTAKRDTVYAYADLPFACHIDSLSYWYLTTGTTSSYIDAVTVFGNKTGTTTPTADSVYAFTTTNATSTTLARVNVVINHDQKVGDRISVKFDDYLNAAGSRSGCVRITLYLKRKQ